MELKGRTRGRMEGRAEGKLEGMDEQAKITARTLHDMGLKPDDIARAVHRPIGLVQEWLGVGMA